MAQILELKDHNQDIEIAKKVAQVDYDVRVSSVNNSLSQETSDRIAGDAASLSAGKSYTDSEITTLNDALVNIINVNKQASEDADTALAGRATALEQAQAIINGNSDVEGSFRKAIADVVGNAPEALDTLAEIATYLNGVDGEVAGSIVETIAANTTAINDQVAKQAQDLANTTQTIADNKAAIEQTVADVVTVQAQVNTTLDTKINEEITQVRADMADQMPYYEYTGSAVSIDGGTGAITFTVSHAPRGGIFRNAVDVFKTIDGQRYRVGEFTATVDIGDVTGKTILIDSTDVDLAGCEAFAGYNYIKTV